MRRSWDRKSLDRILHEADRFRPGLGAGLDARGSAAAVRLLADRSDNFVDSPRSRRRSLDPKRGVIFFVGFSFSPPRLGSWPFGAARPLTS